MKDYTVEELSGKLDEFITSNARYRFVDHHLILAGKKFFENPSRENTENFRRIKELSSNLFIDAIDEAKSNRIIKKAYSILDFNHKKKPRIIPESNHLERGKILWSSNNNEIKKQAAMEFELAGENPDPNSGWSRKELLLLASEAYGRLGMFDKELELHKKIREIG